jgi:uncharacterized membrane protein YphA (DoxX/SURF4 family)
MPSVGGVLVTVHYCTANAGIARMVIFRWLPGSLAAVVRDVVGTLMRIGLGVVWLISGWLKAADPEQTYLAVSAFDVLPAGAVSPVAAGLPFVELALGLLLLVGFGVRPAAVASFVLLVAFVAGVAQAWARGLSIDCGCFGGGGPVDPSQTRYPQELARDLGFLLLAAWLVVRPRTMFAAETLLGRKGRTVERRPLTEEAAETVAVKDGG